MKALTLRPEYAHEVLAGQKTEEYRSWSTSYRGLLVIHSGKPNGCLLCVVDLVDVVPDVYEGYVWLLANVRPVERVLVKGQLGLWNIDPQIVRPLQVDTQQAG